MTSIKSYIDSLDASDPDTHYLISMIYFAGMTSILATCMFLAIFG